MEYRVQDCVLSIEETSAVSDTIYINIDFTEEILSGGKQSEPGVKWTNLPLYSDVKNDGEGMQDIEVKVQYNQITNNSTII